MAKRMTARKYQTYQAEFSVEYSEKDGGQKFTIVKIFIATSKEGALKIFKRLFDEHKLNFPIKNPKLFEVTRKRLV